MGKSDYQGNRGSRIGLSMKVEKPPPVEAPARDEFTARVEANIRAEISAAGLSTRTVRARMGSTSTALQDFLSGRSRSLRVDTLAKVAEALEIPVDRLLAPPDKREVHALFLDILGTLPPEDVQFLVRMLRTLREGHKP